MGKKILKNPKTDFFFLPVSWQSRLDMPKHSSHWNVEIPVFRVTVMAMMA
jgi:hypothetical protein